MDVCNTFHNVILNIIIINLCIKFGTSNVFQHFHRLFDTSNSTKARQEKIGQHKLGPSGYSNLMTRIVSIEKPIMHPNNKLKLFFVLLHHKRYIHDIMKICRLNDSKKCPLRKT